MLTQEQVLLFVVLIYLLLEHHRYAQSHPIVSQNYAADPLLDIERLLQRPGTFRDLFHLEPHVFLAEIVAPLIEHESLPRRYLVRAEYQMFGDVTRERSTQISAINKIARMILFTRNMHYSVLNILFDQSTSTTYDDMHHQAILFVDKLQDRHIQPVIPNSAEFYDLMTDDGAFRHFTRTLYAMDVVKIRMAIPGCVRDTGIYYDGHAHCHTFGYCLYIDRNGICRLYAGHFPGSYNDQSYWYASEFAENTHIYFGLGTKVLVDGIYCGVAPDIFIPPICYLHRPLTPRELRYNFLQSWDRALVENYNHILQVSCPYLYYFKLHPSAINTWFIVCLILTNIRIKFQNRMRQNPL